jgi:hypothetical protein
MFLLMKALGRRAGRRHQRRGSRHERVGARLLKKLGYAVLGEQVAGVAHVIVDGERLESTVHADFVVERHGTRYVAEVKGGALRSATRERTRRQLLEYALVFDVQGLLLVDAIKKSVVEISFGYEAPP